MKQYVVATLVKIAQNSNLKKKPKNGCYLLYAENWTFTIILFLAQKNLKISKQINHIPKKSFARRGTEEIQNKNQQVMLSFYFHFLKMQKTRNF